jgi:hypothetical protein
MIVFRDRVNQTYLQRPHGFKEREEVIYHKIAGL